MDNTQILQHLEQAAAELVATIELAIEIGTARGSFSLTSGLQGTIGMAEALRSRLGDLARLEHELRE